MTFKWGKEIEHMKEDSIGKDNGSARGYEYRPRIMLK